MRVAENVAQAEKGKKAAEADQRVFIQAQEAEAIKGENTARADIAQSNATLAMREAEATQRGEVARLSAQAEIQKAQAMAETERLNAGEVVRQEIERKKVEIAAEAEAERIRRHARGEADAILMRYEAEARGLRQVLESKAAGYESLVRSTGGDARAAATLLMIEKLEQIVEKQVEAIQNLKIDKITVWDSGGGGANGHQSSTANFLASLVTSLPPLQEIAKMAGVELPEYLGRMTEGKGGGSGNGTTSEVLPRKVP